MDKFISIKEEKCLMVLHLQKSWNPSKIALNSSMNQFNSSYDKASALFRKSQTQTQYDSTFNSAKLKTV